MEETVGIFSFQILGNLCWQKMCRSTDHNMFVVGTDTDLGIYLATMQEYFANHITFPIYNINGQVEGIIGRRTDNRGIRWLKQTQEDTYYSLSVKYFSKNSTGIVMSKS